MNQRKPTQPAVRLRS